MNKLNVNVDVCRRFLAKKIPRKVKIIILRQVKLNPREARLKKNIGRKLRDLQNYSLNEVAFVDHH